MTDPLDRLDSTCRAVLDAQARLQAAQDARDRLLHEIRDSGVPAAVVGQRCRSRLLEDGWPEDAVTDRRLGLSDGNVRRALDRARPLPNV